MSARLVFLAAACWAAAAAAPATDRGRRDAGADPPPRVLHDESQEGKWNVRADLKNFVILIIPTRSSTSSPSVGLLDFFRKAPNNREHLQHLDESKKNQDAADAPQETQHFIESKTAPYHVDISSSSAKGTDDIIIANSPTVAMMKTGPEGKGLTSALTRGRRLAKALVFTVPADEEFVLSNMEDNKKVVKKDDVKKETIKKKPVKTPPKQELKLLGAELEQCGPGMARDSYGNCRVYEP